MRPGFPSNQPRCPRPGVALEEAVVLLELYLVVMVLSFSWAVYFIFVSKPVLLLGRT